MPNAGPRPQDSHEHTRLLTNIHTRALALGIPTIPVTPPGAALIHGSTIRPEDCGKVPGRYDPQWRVWAGLGVEALDAMRRAAPDEIVRRWDDWPGQQAGIPCATFPGFDCDVASTVVAAQIAEWLRLRLVERGLWPAGAPLMKRVGRAPKWLVGFRLLDGELASPSWDVRFTSPDTGEVHLIQWLGRGKHFVANGIHNATGLPYAWEDVPGDLASPFDLADQAAVAAAFVPVSVADIDWIRRRLVDFLTAGGWLVTSSGGAGGTGGPGGIDGDITPEKRASLAAPSVAVVRMLMGVLPNDPRVFETRQDWVNMAQALRGALPDDPAVAQELFEAWSAKYPHGQMEDPAANMDRTRPSRAYGWPWILEKARACGVSTLPLEGFPVQTEEDDDDRRLAAIVAQIAGASAAGAANAASAAGGDPGTGTPPPAGLKAPPVHVPPDLKLMPLAAQKARAMTLGPRPFLYGHYYARMVISLLVGRGGVAKTAIALTEALCMVLGRELLGEKTFEVGLRVGHINMDESTAELLRRARAILRFHGVDWDDTDELLIAGNEHLGGMAHLLRLTDSDGRGRVVVRQAGLDMLARLIEQNRLDVLQLDPFGPLTGGLNDNDLTYELTSKLLPILSNTGAGLTLVHHTRKTSGDRAAGGEIDVDDIKGSSALVQAARYARVMRTVGKQEAGLFGIDPTQAWRFIRMDDAKANHSAPDGRGKYIELKTVSLDNGAGLREADRIGVPVLWAPPDTALTPQLRADILAQLEQGPGGGRRYASHHNTEADRSAVALIEGRMGVPRPRAKEVLDGLLRDGSVVEDDYRDPVQRRIRKGIRVVGGPNTAQQPFDSDDGG